MKSSKLTYKNNWESDEYFVGDKLLTSLSEVEIKGKRYKVKANDVGVPYYDMGHQYNAVSTHYFIAEKVFGVYVAFDLNEIVKRVSVKAIKFKTVGA